MNFEHGECDTMAQFPYRAVMSVLRFMILLQFQNYNGVINLFT